MLPRDRWQLYVINRAKCEALLTPIQTIGLWHRRRRGGSLMQIDTARRLIARCWMWRPSSSFHARTPARPRPVTLQCTSFFWSCNVMIYTLHMGVSGTHIAYSLKTCRQYRHPLTVYAIHGERMSVLPTRFSIPMMLPFRQVLLWFSWWFSWHSNKLGKVWCHWFNSS